jgi:uncharacterized membrane protein YfcA
MYTHATMSAMSLVLLLVSVALGAFAQRTTGIGFTLLAGPACALALDPSHALGTLVRLAIVADVLVLLADRSDLDTRALRGFLWPAALAFPLALVAARVVPANALVVVAALATIVAAFALQRSGAKTRRAVMRRTAATVTASRATESLPEPSPGVVVDVHPAATRLAGFAAGFFGVTTGMAGPPLALHATVSGRPLGASRATMTMFFLAVDLAALVAHPTAARPGITAALLVALLAGAFAGGLAAGRVREEHLRRAIPPLVLAGACAALVRVVG